MLSQGGSQVGDGDNVALIVPFFQDIPTGDWSEFYENCTWWSQFWEDTHTPNGNWPSGVQIHGGRMYLEDKLCVPIGLQEAWIREYHAAHGHVGPDRLWHHVEPHAVFADHKKAQEFFWVVHHQCEVCQAVQRPYRLSGPMESTPVPERIMYHMAMDLFHMPKVVEGPEIFDTMVVCVDRHSGWLIVVPCLEKGLTGRKLAQTMVKEWRKCGIPAKLTSDQGSHFTSEWWKTMCAELGIRHAYSQAYHHQANGRAEVAV